MQNHNRHKFRFFIPFFFIAAIGLLTLLVQYLWNWIIAPTFSIATFDFWQSLGLFVLCRILFGSFKMNAPMQRRKQFMESREKWMNMSAEDRQKFKSEWDKRCR